MHTLNQFVTGQLNPEALVNDQGRLQFCREQMQAEKKQITHQLLEISYAPADAGEKESVIQSLQLDVVRLLDTLYYYRLSHQSANGHAAGNDDLTIFYLEVESALQEVLIALEQHFPEYLLPDLPLPFSYAALVRRQMEVRLKELEQLLRSLELDESLIKLMLRPAREFLHNQNDLLSFRALTYLRELMSQLYVTATLEMAQPDKFHLQLHSVLIHLNFNSIEYYLYCINWLRSWLKGYNHLRDRLTFLSWCIKELRSVPLKNRPTGLRLSDCSIAGQLQAWLEEERAFLRSLHEENLQQHPFGQQHAGGKRLADKLLVNLSVAQFALMLRVYIEEGIIMCNSLPQVMLSLSGIIRTGAADLLGEENFETKYNNPSLSTITACKLWMSRLTDRLNDYEKRMRAYVD